VVLASVVVNQSITERPPLQDKLSTRPSSCRTTLRQSQQDDDAFHRKDLDAQAAGPAMTRGPGDARVGRGSRSAGVGPLASVLSRRIDDTARVLRSEAIRVWGEPGDGRGRRRRKRSMP
jgi:hypothetical protein